jgi:hypothetical protein
MWVANPVGKAITDTVLPLTRRSMNPTNIRDVWNRSQERFTLDYATFRLLSGKTKEQAISCKSYQIQAEHHGVADLQLHR